MKQQFRGWQKDSSLGRLNRSKTRGTRRSQASCNVEQVTARTSFDLLSDHKACQFIQKHQILCCNIAVMSLVYSLSPSLLTTCQRLSEHEVTFGSSPAVWPKNRVNLASGGMTQDSVAGWGRDAICWMFSGATYLSVCTDVWHHFPFTGSDIFHFHSIPANPFGFGPRGLMGPEKYDQVFQAKPSLQKRMTEWKKAFNSSSYKPHYEPPLLPSAKMAPKRTPWKILIHLMPEGLPLIIFQFHAKALQRRAWFLILKSLKCKMLGDECVTLSSPSSHYNAALLGSKWGQQKKLGKWWPLLVHWGMCNLEHLFCHLGANDRGVNVFVLEMLIFRVAFSHFPGIKFPFRLFWTCILSGFIHQYMWNIECQNQSLNSILLLDRIFILDN